jgi:stage V sporulation protein K
VAELDHLVGLQGVKRQVHEIWALIEVQRLRRRAELSADPHTLHMVFSGAPGTGKTTVARILGRLFRVLEVLPKGHMVEVERADLVGEYIGHTAQRTRDAVRRALGGVLFVDEAYALARGSDKDFGKEAIDTLVKAMEDHKNEFLLVLAGYPQEMGVFLHANPGLVSRLPIHLTFPNYTPAELILIADKMVAEREYRMTPEAREALSRYLTHHAQFGTGGNGRMVRNLIERAIRVQAVRLMGLRRDLSRDELMTLEWSDLDQDA